MYCIWLRYYYSMTNIAYYSVIITIIMHYMKQVTTNISVKRASSYYRSSSPLSLSLSLVYPQQSHYLQMQFLMQI